MLINKPINILNIHFCAAEGRPTFTCMPDMRGNESTWKVKSREVHVYCSLAVCQNTFNYFEYREFGIYFTIISSLFFLLGCFGLFACLQKPGFAHLDYLCLSPASELNAFRV